MFMLLQDRQFDLFLHSPDSSQQQPQEHLRSIKNPSGRSLIAYTSLITVEDLYWSIISVLTKIIYHIISNINLGFNI